MSKAEMDLIIKLFDTKAKDTDELIKAAMEDIRRTIAVAAANTDGEIQEVNKTLKDHNGRLKYVEDVQEKQGKIVGAIRWIGKHWYVAAGLLLITIVVLIPIVEWLGIKGLISLIK